MQFSTTTIIAVIIALAATKSASADFLRGATNAGTFDQLAHPDVHCLAHGVHTSTDCSAAISSNGSNCVWCQTSEEEGACLSRSDAEKVVNFFGLPCPDYTALLGGDGAEELGNKDLESHF